MVNGDPEQRRRAADDLCDDHDALTGLLEARALEQDPVVAHAILTALTANDCTEVGRALRPDLSSPDADVRNNAVQALQTLPVAVQALVDDGLLVDGDADVRILAVMLLSAVQHPDVPAWLRRVVGSDTDANVLAAAVDVAVTLDPVLATELALGAVARFPDNPYLGFLLRLTGAR